jgi:ubiquinone/menaquinone biosynthesis C-methylase UbiE
MLTKFLAKQLGHPAGVFGRFVLAPMWNKRNAALNKVAFDGLALHPADRVLEVGFGGGYLLGRMAAVVTSGFLAGVDVSPDMVALCAKRYHTLIEAGQLDLKCAPAESLPFPADSFTKACSVNSIFYWKNAPQAIAELWRVLKPGGMVVLCFTCKQSLKDKKFTQHGVKMYEVAEVEQMLVTAGFQNLDLHRTADKHREFWRVTGQKKQ